MSSFEDYDSWRLQTNGGVRYRFLGTTGSFDKEKGEIEWSAIIRSVDLYEVLTELFPPPIIIGGVVIPNAGTMPGFPSMAAKKLSYKNHVEGSPVDPYEYDTDAPLGTYSDYLQITISFSPMTGKASDPANPRTFLEVSCSADGEFIYVPPESSQLQDEVGAAGADDETPGEGGIDAETGEATAAVVPAAKRPNRSPILPSSVLVPSLKWSVKWKQIPAQHFANVVIHRLRLMLGRVNSTRCDFLYNAPPETLLFMGFTHSESYSWRLGNLDAAPIDVDLTIIEKRVLHRGVVCGHNHIFEPGNGWVRQWIGASFDEPLHRLVDMNFIFKV